MRALSVAIGASLLLGVVSLSSQAEAKDLTGRAGVGYTNTIPGTGSAISARYWVNPQFGIEGNLGMLLVDPDEGDSQNNFGIGLGVLYAFIAEPNLNVYGTGGLSFGSVSAPAPTTGNPGATEGKTAIGFGAGMGTEWFFVGTPNLGFTTQFGLTFTSVQDSANTISLGGGEFAQFGVRYYFGGPKGPGL